VGPVGAGYLARQLDAAKITPDSLVWREGLPEWRPLNSFDELRPLISAKATPSVPQSTVSAPVALTRKKGAEGLSQVAVATRLMSDAEQEGSKAKSAQAEIQTELGPEPEAMRTPLPVVEPEASSSKPANLASPASIPEAAPEPSPQSGQPELEDEFAFPPRASIPSSVPPSSTELAEGLLRPRRRQVHPVAWAFVAMAAAFGGVSAWFLFGQPRPEPEVAMNTPSASLAGPDVPAPDPAPSEPGDQPVSDAAGGAGAEATPQPGGFTPGPRPGGQDSKAKATDDKPAPKKPCSPDDPFCSSVEGPSQKGPSSGDSGSSGQGLSPEQLQATVGQYRGSLTRSCRPLVTQGSAKVSATVTVGPSGAVQSVATSGGSEVPGLASCVQSRIRNWRFPTSGGTSTFNVSFNFL
jgi:hypothetical protein